MASLIIRRTVIFGTPVLLGTLAAIHPLMPADDVAVWNLIHGMQIPLVALLGIAVVFLLRGTRGRATRAARLAIIPWAAFFAAFDGVAGLATGALAEYGHTHPHVADAVHHATDSLGGSFVIAALLPSAATLFSFVVFGGAAVALARRGTPVYAAAAIAIGGVVWTFVHPIIGAPAMLVFLVGAAVADLLPGRVPSPAPALSHAAAR
jgi:hypothetical protein